MNKRNVSIDIFRVIFAIVVIQIHTIDIYSGVLRALVCLAVPFFSITAGYFSGKHTFKKELKYVLRLCFLALVMILLNQIHWLWLCIMGSMSFFRDVSFYSKWIEVLLLSQAWTIVAFIISIIVKWLFFKYKKIVCICSILIHCIYYFLYYLNGTNLVKCFSTNNYTHLLSSTILGIMPFYFMGLLIYEYKDKLPKISNINMLIIMIVYFVERSLMNKYVRPSILYVPFIVLVPLFIWILNNPTIISGNENTSKLCSIMADIMYVSQGFIIAAYKELVKIDDGGNLFFVTIIICAFGSMVLYYINPKLKKFISSIKGVVL